MKSALIRVTTATVAIAATATLLAQQPTFKTGTQIVPLYVTVTDADKRLVPDLTKADFEVFDNAQPVTLTLFQNEPEPFSCVVSTRAAA